MFIDSFILAPFKSFRGILMSVMSWFLLKAKSSSGAVGRAELSENPGALGERGAARTALLGLGEHY